MLIQRRDLGILLGRLQLNRRLREVLHFRFGDDFIVGSECNWQLYQDSFAGEIALANHLGDIGRDLA